MTSELDCCVCTDMFTNPVSLGCNHVLCKQCWDHIRSRNMTSTCPLCRSTDLTPGRPCVELEDIVRNTGRHRPCGKLVTDTNLRAHESACAPCWDLCVQTLHNEVKNMMAVLLRAKAESIVAERRNKRKIDECEELQRSNDSLRRELSHNNERESRRKRRLE